MASSIAKRVWATACDVERHTSSLLLAMLTSVLIAIKVQEHIIWHSGEMDTTWLWLSLPLCAFYVRHYRYRCAHETTSCLEVAKQGDTAFAAYFCFFLFHLLLTLRVGGAVSWPFCSMVLLPCYGWTLYLLVTLQWQAIVGVQAIVLGLHADAILPWSWPAVFLPTWAFLAAIAMLLPRALEDEAKDVRAILRVTVSVICLFLPVLPLVMWLSTATDDDAFSLYAIFLPWLVPIGNYLVYSLRTLPSTPQSARETSRLLVHV
ncbi:hypothetical protein SPRG_00075 [Saprolegnia parasitica CBS 223.65]|uniref:Uncharacterized protein n=1 Tax=Saprolegnia parasitica (strain CBS 223.65) TaxID=695850 RepID=A0A067D176_SAPPC|nr:hypothetical protein SPRG_00075 [Saprolegnia parasitica CBS 223.65]KDO35230.1 hypothetical protein SPRG_00075 [Saprolegnia parasitica CBS 223.65]|eukprot:XP_012193581.1 hypothetical protein SPRG_00075 [Saprolegnia parasitica CBS 223.65]